MSHEQFSNRLQLENKIIQQFTGQKVIASVQSVHAERLQMLWGTPYEMLLLSRSAGVYPASVIIDEYPGKRSWAKQFNKSLIVNWNIYLYKDLTKYYFPFTDTTSTYKIIE